MHEENGRPKYNENQLLGMLAGNQKLTPGEASAIIEAHHCGKQPFPDGGADVYYLAEIYKYLLNVACQSNGNSPEKNSPKKEQRELGKRASYWEEKKSRYQSREKRPNWRKVTRW